MTDPRRRPKADQIIEQAELVCERLFQIGVHDDDAATELAKLQRLLWEYRKL